MNDSAAEEPVPIQRAREAKRRFEEELAALPRVRGLGVGYKIRDGKETDELAVVVLVDEKVPKSRLEPRHVVPETLSFVSTRDGRETAIGTDIQVTAAAIPGAHLTAADIGQLKTRLRPSPGGVTIASPSGSGTLGGWALDDATGEFVFLSNEHVLGSTVGATVMQPFFPQPGDTTDYRFGTVLRSSATFDASVGVPLRRADVATEISGDGPAIYEIGTATLGMDVEKTGSTTGHTEGRVSLIDVTTVAPCARSRTAFRISPVGAAGFTQVGDSGSAIMERKHPAGLAWKRAVGLLYCMVQDGSVGYAHQMTDIFSDLGLVTVCEALARIIDAIFLAATPATLSGSHGFARDFARRLEEGGGTGTEIVEIVSNHRKSAVQFILGGDGRRAVEAALHPLLRDVVITDDLLDQVISDADVARLGQLLDVADRAVPEARPAITRAKAVLAGMLGAPLRSVLLADGPETKRKA